MRKVIIIGGGLSGLAAAVKLSSAGYHPQVLEQRSVLGGRTYSFREKSTGDIVDNGQHLLLDCYSHTFAYLSTINAVRLVKIEPELSLHFVHPLWGASSIRISRKLPPRAALIKGLAGFSFLSLTDRLSLLKAGHKIFTSDENYTAHIADLTVEQWLDELKQTENVKKCFWYPLAIAIMNETPERASAELFARAIKIGVFDRKGPASIVTPLRGLSEVFVVPAVTHISRNGGKVDCNRRVTGLLIQDARVRSVVLSDGSTVAGDVFIVTGQPAHIKPILEASRSNFPAEISYVPIITCDIWFERTIDLPSRIGLIDTKFQWVFRKDAAFGNSDGRGYLSMVMSGARDHIHTSAEDLINLAVDDLHACFPPLRTARIRHYRVIKEKRATVSLTPTVQKLRPPNQTDLTNLFLAGDWTQTNLPATIEGAILSGFRAAELVMNDRER